MKMDILILRGTGLKRGQGRRASAVQPYKDSFPSTTNTMVKEKQKASMRGKANGNPNKNCTACDFCTVLEESLIWPWTSFSNSQTFFRAVLLQYLWKGISYVHNALSWNSYVCATSTAKCPSLVDLKKKMIYAKNGYGTIKLNHHSSVCTCYIDWEVLLG